MSYYARNYAGIIYASLAAVLQEMKVKEQAAADAKKMKEEKSWNENERQERGKKKRRERSWNEKKGKKKKNGKQKENRRKLRSREELLNVHQAQWTLLDWNLYSLS